MTGENEIRVMLVDDHTVVRSGLGAVIGAADGLLLVGEAGDGEEALRVCEKARPDVILMDLLMPRMDGVAATQAVLKTWPHIKVIALTSFAEKEYVEGALQAGATGYLLKNISAAELVAAIRRAVSGQPSLSPEAAQVLITKINQPAAVGYDITGREKEILNLMVDGLSNADIAGRLVVSQSTVKFHVSNILSKLGVASRTEAVALAIRHKLVK
jgi:NarL family two-component system response regulator LiaR